MMIRFPWALLLALPLFGCPRNEPKSTSSSAPFFPKALDTVPGDKFDVAALQMENLLTDLADRLQNRAPADAAAQFAPDFAGVPPLSAPAGAGASRKLAGEAVEIVTWTDLQAASSVGVRESFETFLRDCVRISSCRFKMPEMDIWEGGTFGKLKLEINAERSDGSGVSIQEQFDGVLVLKDREWKIQRLRRTGRREVRCTVPLAREVARASGLQGNPEAGAAIRATPYDGMRGIAAGDLDGDGFHDVVVVSCLEVRVFRNLAGRGFEDVSRASGVKFGSPATGALLWDYDADGDLDLAISQYTGAFAALGQPDPRAVVLWRNDGGLKFSDATSTTGIASNGPATSLAAADVDRDGDLDLYVVMYGGNRADARGPVPSINARNGTPNQLWINQGNGKFTEVSAKAGVADTGWGLAVAFGDLEADGYPDLYIANDFGPHRLYRNRKDGTFEEVAGDQGFGMGVSWGDYDNDGDLDLYVSNMYSNAGKRMLRVEKKNLMQQNYELARKSSEGNTLFRNDQGKLVDATPAAGVGPAGWAWANTFVDWDNDGWQDLFVVNGYISGLTKRDR